MMMDAILRTADKLLDFGPPLAYNSFCQAYTVERLSMWEHQTDNKFEIVVVRAPGLPRARLEGTLYKIDEDGIKDLDKKRGVGVYCERRYMPVYISSPKFRDPVTHLWVGGALVETKAHVYVGNRDFWTHEIEFGRSTVQNFMGQFVPKEPTFRLAEQVSHQDCYLHNRFVFLAPPRPIATLGNPPPPVRRHVARSNQWLGSYGWKRKLYKFVND